MGVVNLMRPSTDPHPASVALVSGVFGFFIRRY